MDPTTNPNVIYQYTDEDVADTVVPRFMSTH